MEELKTLLFDIQPFSVHDGPGSRTNVFFVGCPLHCKWCANPEGFGSRKHLMFAEGVCKYEDGCNVCKGICPYDSISYDEKGKPSVDWGKCITCTTFECSTICPNNVFKVCGKEYTVAELYKILLRDAQSWGAEGGVTFTGGECTMHYDFLLAILKKCKAGLVHTAIETCAYTPTEHFLEIFKYINFAFIDIKNMDDEMHKEGTGVSNKLILRNIEEVVKSDWHGRLVLRQPTIHDYNDSDENAKKTIAFMKKNGLFEINLLKFHRYGQTKWEQLGKTYEYADKGGMTQERMIELQNMYLDEGIAAYIGDDTPF